VSDIRCPRCGALLDTGYNCTAGCGSCTMVGPTHIAFPATAPTVLQSPEIDRLRARIAELEAAGDAICAATADKGGYHYSVDIDAHVDAIDAWRELRRE